MFDRVVLSKDGLTALDWDGDTREYIGTPVGDDAAFFGCLRCECEVAEGTSLRDIFRCVGRFPGLKEFFRCYSDCPNIDAYHRDSERPGGDPDPFQYLEVYRCVSSSEFEGNQWFEDSVGFHAIGEASEEAMTVELGYTPYGLMGTRVREYAGLEVRLNRDFEVDRTIIPNRNGPIDRATFPARGEFTLLEILHAIYWEISWGQSNPEGDDA